MTESFEADVAELWEVASARLRKNNSMMITGIKIKTATGTILSMKISMNG
jgi:hypothetical protein